MCRVLAKELFSNSGLSGCRVHAFDHCPCFSLRNFILGIGGGVSIYLLSIQCHIAPRLLSLRLAAGPQCALSGRSLRKSSPTLSHGGHIVSPESWLAAPSTVADTEGWLRWFAFGTPFPFQLDLVAASVWIQTQATKQCEYWHLAKLECVCQTGRFPHTQMVPPWSCLLDHCKEHS